MTMPSSLERQDSLQHAVILPALLWNREYADFYAVTCSLAPDGIRFRSATVPQLDERLTCSIRHIGSLDVRIVGTGTNAFTVKPAGDRRHSATLARMLVDLAHRQTDAPERLRGHRRIVPQRTDLQVTLACGTILPGRLVDVSASGAAVYLGMSLDAGVRIRLGSTDAVVVRGFGTGVGASFLVPLDPATVSEDLVL